MMDLAEEIAACRLCAAAFAATATAHEPRPVLRLSPGAPILVFSQAPGARVHVSGRPFDDPSGVRLRDWMGIGEDVFWDRGKVAFLPMAFCFPGYDAKGHDLPPPKICVRTWGARVRAAQGPAPLTLVVGAAAQKWHLGRGPGVDRRVAAWRDHAPAVFPLPHPSWRNTAWLKRNPWFAAELVPALRTRVREVLE